MYGILMVDHMVYGMIMWLCLKIERKTPYFSKDSFSYYVVFIQGLFHTHKCDAFTKKMMLDGVGDGSDFFSATFLLVNMNSWCLFRDLRVVILPAEEMSESHLGMQ